MSKTLKDLFNGDLSLADRPMPKGSEMHKLSTRLCKCEESLAQALDEPEKAQLEILTRTQWELNCLTAEENFILGFRLAVQIMAECLGGELVALEWSDLDMERQTLTISKSAGRFRGQVRIRPSKTANSVRTVFLPKETVDLLVKERRKHPFAPVMFPSPVTGQMYGPDCVGRLHRTLCKKAGISENIRFHDLRHTYATLAIQNGVDAKTVSTILGHYSAGFTLDTYTHTTPAMQQAAAEKVGSFIAQAV